MLLYLAPYLGHNRHSVKCEITERNIPADCGRNRNPLQEIPWTEEPGGLQSMGSQKESNTI